MHIITNAEGREYKVCDTPVNRSLKPTGRNSIESIAGQFKGNETGEGSK